MEFLAFRFALFVAPVAVMYLVTDCRAVTLNRTAIA
jgi:hypothetical protein